MHSHTVARPHVKTRSAPAPAATVGVPIRVTSAGGHPEQPPADARHARPGRAQRGRCWQGAAGASRSPAPRRAPQRAMRQPTSAPGPKTNQRRRRCSSNRASSRAATAAEKSIGAGMTGASMNRRSSSCQRCHVRAHESHPPGARRSDLASASVASSSNTRDISSVKSLCCSPACCPIITYLTCAGATIRKGMLAAGAASSIIWSRARCSRDFTACTVSPITSAISL